MMAEPACNVAGCLNTIKNKTPGTRFFRFPKKKDIKKVWIERCRRPGLWDPDLCLVCSEHFGENDYNRDLRMKVDGPDNGLRLKKCAVPSLKLDDPDRGNGAFGSSPAVGRTTTKTMTSRQQKIDVVLQPKSDPLALNEGDSNVDQTDDTSFTECKADIKDLISPPEYGEEARDHFGQSECDPLDISDLQLKNAGCTQQDKCKFAVTTTGTIKTYSNNKQARKKLCPSSKRAENLLRNGSGGTDFSSCVIFGLIYVKPFSSLSSDEQRLVMLAGKPASDINSLNKASKRVSLCQEANNPLSLKQLWWITSSKLMNKIFCWPCVLFGKRESIWNSEGLSHVLPDEVKKHEKTNLHISSFFQYSMLAKDYGVQPPCLKRTQQVSAQISVVGKNHEIFLRLIDAVCILPKMEMPNLDQAHNRLSSVQEAYLNIVHTFSEYDASLKSYLRTAHEKKLTSGTVRDDLIRSVESVMLDRIKQELESVKCVSFICGHVTDEIGTVDKPIFTSVVLRYVDNDGNCRERFVGYYENTNSTSSVKILRHRIVQLTIDLKLVGKLVFFSSDGQFDRIHWTDALSYCSPVIYVPTFRKSFTLVLKQACSGIDECRLFIATLPRLSAFFSKTSKQRIELESFFGKIVPEFYPAVLDFESNLERTVYKFLPQLLKFFENIIENAEDWDEDTVVSALGFKAFLQSFTNIFFLHLFASLFNHTNLLYQTPEFMKFTDYDTWATRLHSVKLKVFMLHKRLEKFWKEIVAKDAECNVATDPSQPKKDAEKPTPFYTRLYSEIINLIHDRIGEELASFDLLKFLSLLNPTCFGSNAPPSAESLQLLHEVFPNYFDVNKLKSELIVLYGISDLRTKLPHKYIGHLGTLRDAQQLIEVHKLVCLYLTIPSTQASLEPSFSALKRMKNVHELLGHHPSSNLAVLAIENDLLSQLKELPDFYSRVLNEYAKRGNELDVASTDPKVSKPTSSNQS